ncbi:Uncharacterized protein C2A9.02 [Coccomyxa sp. Obi]|nr:Uncharacterized protein C2A9.02 [Coccomyxa sp. Obi]
MKVFLTGPRGFVGTEVARLLLLEGHSVVGLARSEARAEDLRKSGIEPVLGELCHFDVLARAAASADAVIHTAFFHTGDYEEGSKLVCTAVRAITEALAGSGKPFIMSSGTDVLGDTGLAPVSEEFPVDPHHSARPTSRVLCEREALVAAGKDVRAMVLRLPPYVWGNGDGFCPLLHIQAAHKLGRAYYILPGTQKTCGVHVEDLARLYLLALEKGAAGSIYHATASTDLTAREVGEAVGANAGVPAEGISKEDAHRHSIWPDWAIDLFALNNAASSAKAQKDLGWTNLKTGMLQDIACGSYVQNNTS